MESGFSLHNGGTSLNFDVPAVSIVGGREEEDEAAEDEKNKQKELEAALTNAFDDLEDDDFDSSHFSVQDNSVHQATSNHLLKEWLNGNGTWLTQSKNRDESKNDQDQRDLQLDDDDSNNRLLLSKKQNYSNRYNQSQNSSVNSSSNNNNNSLTKMNQNGGDANVEKCGDVDKNVAPRQNGGYWNGVGVNGGGGLNGHNSPSTDSCPSPAIENGHGEGDNYDYDDDGDGDDFNGDYGGRMVAGNQDFLTLRMNRTNGILSNEDNEMSMMQQQFIHAGLNGGNQRHDLIQLQILYRARGRELDNLQEEYEAFKLASEAERSNVQEELLSLRNDNEDLRAALSDTQKCLEESKEKQNRLEGQLAAMDKRCRTLESNKDELVQKLQVAESTIESLHHQVEELQSSDSLARSRQQHESIMASTQKRHESDMASLREKLEVTKRQLEETASEFESSKQQVVKLNKLLEQAQLDRAETINRLTKSLEASQRQCQELLDVENFHSMRNLSCGHGSNQKSAAASSERNEINTLQEEVKGLKVELEVLESACKLGVFPAVPAADDSLNHQYANVRKRLDWKSPSPSSLEKKQSNSSDVITALKGELERCLVFNKEKRSKMAKMQADRQAALQELEMVKVQLAEAEKQATNLKVTLAECQARLGENDGSRRTSSAHHRELDHLKKQRDHLTKELREANRRLQELEGTESKLTEANQRLHTQMADMVQDSSEDRRQALERCQQTYLQLHEESIKKIRKEMSELHAEDIRKLTEELHNTTKELDSVKELYVSVCQAKNESEVKLAEELKKKDEHHQKKLSDIENYWMSRVKDGEEEKQECVLRAVEAAKAERDREWKQELDSQQTEKDKEVMQRVFELTSTFETEKSKLVRGIEEKKDVELVELKRTLEAEKRIALAELAEKLEMEKSSLKEVIEKEKKELLKMKDLEAEEKIRKLTSEMNEERLEALQKMIQQKDKEKKVEFQELTLRRKKEWWDKMKELKEKKEQEKSMELKELELKHEEEMKILEDMKNTEIEEIKSRFLEKEKEFEGKLEQEKEKMKKEKQHLFNLLQETKNRNNFEKIKNYESQKEKEKQEALQELEARKQEEKQEALKALREEKEAEMMNALLQLANRKEREKEELVQEYQRQLQSKEQEKEDVKQSLSEHLQSQSHDMLVSFAARKDQERHAALKELSEKQKKELAEALMVLTVNKDMELRETKRKLEKQKEQEKQDLMKRLTEEHQREIDNLQRKSDTKMDLAFLKILQDQNGELFKMLKNAREEFDKEKGDLHQQYQKIIVTLKEKHLRILTRTQADLQEKERFFTEAAEKAADLSLQATKLDAEVTLLKTKVRELETNLVLKTLELERVAMDNSCAKETEDALKSTVDDLKRKLNEAEESLLLANRNKEKLDHDLDQAMQNLRELQEKQRRKVEQLMEEKNKLEKSERMLTSLATDLKNKLESKEADLQNSIARWTREVDDLKLQLQQAQRDKESAVASVRTTLESGVKSTHEELQESIQVQEGLREKIRRYQKQKQQREQQHRDDLLKLQQDHANAVKELMVQLDELKNVTTTTAENRLHELNRQHQDHLATVVRQHEEERRKHLRELDTLKATVQQYEVTYKQLQHDTSRESIAAIQDNINQVVQVLQKDIFQYIEGLNQRVSQRIQREVTKERNKIIAALREQLGVASQSGNNKDSNSLPQSSLPTSRSSAFTPRKQNHSSTTSVADHHGAGGSLVVPKAGRLHPSPMVDSVLNLIPTIRELEEKLFTTNDMFMNSVASTSSVHSNVHDNVHGNSDDVHGNTHLANGNGSNVHSNVHSNTHSNVHSNTHSNVHSTIHSNVHSNVHSAEGTSRFSHDSHGKHRQSQRLHKDFVTWSLSPSTTHNNSPTPNSVYSNNSQHSSSTLVPKKSPRKSGRRNRNRKSAVQTAIPQQTTHDQNEQGRSYRDSVQLTHEQPLGPSEPEVGQSSCQHHHLASTPMPIQTTSTRIQQSGDVLTVSANLPPTPPSSNGFHKLNHHEPPPPPGGATHVYFVQQPDFSTTPAFKPDVPSSKPDATDTNSGFKRFYAMVAECDNATPTGGAGLTSATCATATTTSTEWVALSSSTRQ